MKKRKSDTMQADKAAAPSATEIAALAHSYWEAEGRPEGDAWRHWLRAEADLTAAAETGPKESA